MIYPIKTLSQLPLVLKGFRKDKRLTQAALAERLGITQQSYAYFEANPATATLERLFMVLRLLGVEISLGQTSPATSKETTPSVALAGERPATVKAMGQEMGKSPSAVAIRKTKPSATAKAGPIAAPARKKESW
ncbi:MAG: helix-turn-helix domain-containing protein [Pseudomonadota bacterium]|nr:helix-turn-helix domain-containing protein [Pseudomonadota bacterium]